MQKQEKLEKQKKENKFKKFKKEFRKQTIIAIMAAFGFLMALSWRDFISELVSHIVEYFTLGGQLYLYKLFSAIIVTLIAVIGIIIVSKFNADDKK
jgi:uncharacterized membrane protein YdbT with pleckstrin-like domain